MTDGKERSLPAADGVGGAKKVYLNPQMSVFFAFVGGLNWLKWGSVTRRCGC